MVLIFLFFLFFYFFFFFEVNKLFTEYVLYSNNCNAQSKNMKPFMGGGERGFSPVRLDRFIVFNEPIFVSNSYKISSHSHFCVKQNLKYQCLYNNQDQINHQAT